MISNILWSQIVVDLKHKFSFSEIKPIINRHYLQSFHGLIDIINIIIKDYPTSPFLCNLNIFSLLDSDELPQTILQKSMCGWMYDL